MKLIILFIIMIIIIMFIISHNIYDQALLDSSTSSGFTHEYIKKTQNIRQIFDKDIILFDNGVVQIDLKSGSVIITNANKKEFRFTLDDIGSYIPLIFPNLVISA